MERIWRTQLAHARYDHQRDTMVCRRKDLFAIFWNDEVIAKFIIESFTCIFGKNTQYLNWRPEAEGSLNSCGTFLWSIRMLIWVKMRKIAKNSFRKFIYYTIPHNNFPHPRLLIAKVWNSIYYACAGSSFNPSEPNKNTKFRQLVRCSDGRFKYSCLRDRKSFASVFASK